MDKYIGNIFINKYGQRFVVLELVKKDSKNSIYKIKFESGYESNIYASQIRTGSVADRFSPSVAGVGIVGDTHMTRDKLYRVWHNMINRCYNPNSTEYPRYGALGVTVCQRWHWFQNFLEDIVRLPGYNQEDFYNGKIFLDKDVLCEEMHLGYKIYSPYTCKFITARENTLQACSSGPISAIDINTGEELFYESQSDFALANRIPVSQATNTLLGLQPSCHGYRLLRVPVTIYDDYEKELPIRFV